MDLAIFWLPLLAGLLLGGLAVGAWYGGDKTLAIWVGFIGICCLLLTAALQIQQQVWRTANQPNLTLTTTDVHSVLRWDPANSYQMQINDNPSPPYGTWKVPTLKIKNSGSFAQDAKITWGAAPYEVKSLVDSAVRFKTHQVIVESDRITFGPQPGQVGPVPFVHPLHWSGSLSIPFITREAETFIPLEVWETAALFFIGTLSDEPSARSAPYVFDAQISWKIPDGGKPRQFKVTAVAVNAKPPGLVTPAFLANIEIAVAEAK